MGFKCGIVGLPNVGKSTLFNALTKAKVDAQNYPFCTIAPNLGVVTVPDKRLNEVAKIVNPKKIVPTTVEFVDIAGLVEGASKGEGLGNKFLAHIRETDAIVHIVRCFDSAEVVHISGKVDPDADIATVNTELLLADLETVEKQLNKSRDNSKSGDAKIISEKNFMETLKKCLDRGEPVRTLQVENENKSVLKNLHFLTEKKVVYIANVAENGFKNNPYLESVKKVASREGAAVVPVCAAIEAELADFADGADEYLKAIGFEEPGLNRVIRAVYKLLGLQTFFTTESKEVRAWTCPSGTHAPGAAGKIHTDFEKGFIRAEVIAYNDFIQLGGETAAKEAGKLRSEGKDYMVQDGDVITFRFNV